MAISLGIYPTFSDEPISILQIRWTTRSCVALLSTALCSAQSSGPRLMRSDAPIEWQRFGGCRHRWTAARSDSKNERHGVISKPPFFDRQGGCPTMVGWLYHVITCYNQLIMNKTSDNICEGARSPCDVRI